MLSQIRMRTFTLPPNRWRQLLTSNFAFLNAHSTPSPPRALRARVPPALPHWRPLPLTSGLLRCTCAPPRRAAPPQPFKCTCALRLSSPSVFYIHMPDDIGTCFSLQLCPHAQGEPLPAFPNGGRFDKLGKCSTGKTALQVIRAAAKSRWNPPRVPSDSVIRPSTLNKGKERSHNRMSLVLWPRPLHLLLHTKNSKIVKTGNVWRKTDAQVPQPWLEERSLYSFLSQWEVNAQHPLEGLRPLLSPIFSSREPGEHTN